MSKKEQTDVAIVDQREQDAIALGAKHCIYFGDNEEYRLYLIEITRQLLSPVWNKFMFDPNEAAETLLGTIVILSVSDFDSLKKLSSGSFLAIADELFHICSAKKNRSKKL